MQPYRFLFIIVVLLMSLAAYSQQQDVDFHLAGQFLIGKQVLKVKRDFNDPYVWVLAAQNEIYRINSGTMVVDDYTAKFSQYNNFQFIDIAGSSQDRVFVATNSTNVIDYNNNITKVIGAGDGLTDPVNSIGIAGFSGEITYGSLEIGTTRGRGEYNVTTGKLFYYTFNTLTDNKIYEATYRNFTAKENSYEYYAPSWIPISIYGEGAGLIADIVPIPASGSNVITAFGAEPVLISPGGGAYETSVFWGNEKGLFEESPTYFNVALQPYNQYLQGIKVNKITDIYGFASLDNPYDNNRPNTISNENLLVGTDNGLYFSSSIYGNFKNNGGGFLHAYSMFHYDALGTIPVNDISVNGSAGQYVNTPYGCEDGVWVACNNGLYFIKPDYAKYLDPTTRLQAVQCENIPFPDNSTTVKVCSGETARFYLNTNIPATNSVQWVKDGVDLPGKTGLTLQVTTPGDYYAILYASCENVHVETNHFTVQVINGPVFSLNYPDQIQNCNNDPLTLQTDNNPAYTYRWYTNGILNGETSASYTVTQSGKYKVEVSACTDSWVPSKEIEVDLIDLPLPQITSAKTTYCQGDEATINLNIPADNSYTINWYLDGNVLAGDKNQLEIKATKPGAYSVSITSILKSDCIHNSPPLTLDFISAPAFSFNYPDKFQNCNNNPVTLKTDDNPIYSYRWYTNDVLNGGTSSDFVVTQSGKYKVEVSACTNSWIPSKEIEVDLIQLPVPVVTADKTKYCAGDNANLTVNIPTDPGYTINWYQDGNLVPAGQDKTSISVTADGNYTVIVKSNIASCSQTSASQQVIFTPAPIFTFNYPDELRYCAGTAVSLTAGGDVAYQYRWYKDDVLTGDVSASLNITQAGKYKVEVSACEGSWVPSKLVQVDLIPLPVPVIQADKAGYCIGDNAALSIALSSSPDYTINWYKDNILLPANTNQTSLNTTITGQYAVSIVNNLANTDGNTCIQSSALKSITFNPLPTVSIQKTIRTTLCDGQPVDLKVDYGGGSVKWSTGESGDQITVHNSGIYVATVTSVTGCPADASIGLTFLPNPVLNIPNAGVCLQSNKTVTLTAPSGLTTYTWNGQRGTDTYVAYHPQTVSLTVTDANGCQATQDIQVTDECPSITIPNAFTPNGDGINDTWKIAGLEYDQTATVKIYSRYGESVYQSRGYTKNWDGTSKGKQLPSGVYYYIITAKNNTSTYSGSLTIIY
ncbi:MAG: hypothetical protein JWP37_2334 [Mucilaginibacter sp.]|nr:hypothetical protein [Mucilaginibacter sp.]